MNNVLIINGGQSFEHSSGRFNKTISLETEKFFKNINIETNLTNVVENYDPFKEIEKFILADIVIYHTPIWWFQLPHKLKEYIDIVLTKGHGKIYKNDGRTSSNLKINYGTGGLLHGKKYMITTSWNAPKEAFTLKGEFFDQTSVDDGILFGFHKMNSFIGMTKLESFHFHDVEKDPNINNDIKSYNEHLSNLFSC